MPCSRWSCLLVVLLAGCAGAQGVRPILWAFPDVPRDDPTARTEQSLELVWNDSTALPEYPNGPALWTRTTSEVVVAFRVRPDGTILPGSVQTTIVAVRDFRQPTIDAVSRWRFVPFGENGRDPTRWTQIGVGFLLGEDCQPGRPQRVARWDLRSSTNKMLYVTHCIPELRSPH